MCETREGLIRKKDLLHRYKESREKILAEYQDIYSDFISRFNDIALESAKNHCHYFSLDVECETERFILAVVAEVINAGFSCDVTKITDKKHHIGVTVKEEVADDNDEY